MDKNYVSGVRVFDKHPNAPDFVLASIVITPWELTDWMEKNQDKVSDYKGKAQIKMQIKKSKEGKVYCELDTYKKDDSPKTEKTFTKDTDSSLPF